MTTPQQPQAGPRQDDPAVDELRQRLRALGYLDAGVDRFVLGPARSARRPLAIAALASLRIGLLAAALLGPAAAIGIGSRLPGLVTGTRDALVVALYLAVLFGAAAMVVSFLASVVVARLPEPLVSGRPRLIARGAGVIVTTGCLVYLTSWWRIASADGGALSPVWTAFVLCIAVAISLLLGHATSITAFAVLAATRDGEPQVTMRERSPWRLTAAGAVLAFAGAAGLLLMAAPEAPEASAPPALAVVSPGARLTVLGIDGFDPAVMQALSASGRVPDLSRLLANGPVRLAADAVRDPAREWTTIATGQPPAIHGVHGLETRRVAGLQGSVTSGEPRGLTSRLRDVTDLLRLTRPSTASGAELRAKTFWEVAADAGLRAAVVNWWATWPAAVGGAQQPVVISDRAVLRLERGGALDGEIAPPGLYEQLRGDWPSIRRQAEGHVASLLPPATDPETAAVLRRAAEVDALQAAIASRLERRTLDLLAIYLPGLDIAQHALIGSGDALPPSVLSARLEGLRGYYVYLDALVRELAPANEGSSIMLVAQPGRIATIPHGLIGLSGPIAAANVHGEGRPLDIAPTVLHALGIPVSRELAGTPALALFSNEFRARFPVRAVSTYGQRSGPTMTREGTPLDQEMIERLRSLGYVR